MSPRHNRKRRFSVVLCKTTFSDGVLEIRGRLWLTSFLLFCFTVGLWAGVILGQDFPIPVRLMMGLGALITLYGFLDVFFGECYLRYEVARDHLVVRRGSFFGRASYEGPSAGQAQVSRVSAGKTKAGESLYTIVFNVKLPDAIANFPLEVASCTKETSEARIAYWEGQLGFQS